MNVNYEPVPSTEAYLTADKFINLIVGPVGSTKTTASILKIAYEAARVAKCRDGIRRSRCAVIRNTRQMLWDTTIPDFLKWFPDGMAGTLYKTDSKFLMKFDDVECEVLFRGLDDANDVRRLLSLQLTFSMMDEFREIHPDVYNALTGRLGRYPDKTMNGVGACDDEGRQIHKVWGASNPPDSDTFFESMLVDPPKNVHVTLQPSGRSPEADWVQHLPDGYYENLCEGKSEDWIAVYVDGKFGRSLAGLPVFRCFDRGVHVAKEPLAPRGQTLVIGLDAGLNPTAVITQQTYDGRVMVLDAVTGLSGGMGALRFCREILKPLISAKYRNHIIACVIDPAAYQRGQADEKTVADIFKNEGFTIKPASTNAISARLAAGEAYMTRTVNGNAGLLIDPGCTQLIHALAGKYRYKIDKKGETADTPEKNHPYSDFCFPAGTPVRTPLGDVPIEQLHVGHSVLSHAGVEYVQAAGARYAPELIRLELSDGRVIVTTPEHPFAVETHTCFLRADELTSSHTLVDMDVIWQNGRSSIRESKTQCASVWSAVTRSLRRSGASIKVKVESALQNVVRASAAARALSWTVFGLGDQEKTRISGTKRATGQVCPCTDTCGSDTTALYLTDCTSTTSTKTQPTMPSTTCSLCSSASTNESTCVNGTPAGSCVYPTPPVQPPQSGTDQTQGGSGTQSTQQKSRLTVVRKDYLSGDVVYNLTTSKTNTYVVDGVLVHNCDALTYACLHHDKGGIFGRSMANVVQTIEVVGLGAWT